MSLLAIAVLLAATLLAAVLVGSLLIVPGSYRPESVEGAAVLAHRHVIATCLTVLGAGTPWLASFGNARGLVLLMCFAALGGAYLVWKRSPMRWLVSLGGLGVLVGELA